VEFVRKAVRAIGRVAIKLEEAAERCVRALSELVVTRVTYVVQESVIVIKDIFRRYPQKYEKIIVTLCENLEVLDEPEAKASMVWIIGEYAERIVDAEERLEYFVETFEEESATVQLQLLTATVKLFLKNPEKSKGLVQKVLNLATEKSDNPDLRDRGYVYWRLLSTDPAAAKAVVLASRPEISAETFSLPQDYLSELLDNVSTLAAVYHRSPGEFVRETRKVIFKAHAEKDGEARDESSEEERSGGEEGYDNDQKDDYKEEKEDDLLDDEDNEKEKPKSATKNNASSKEEKKVQEVDLLDIFGGVTTTTTTAKAAPSKTTTASTVTPGEELDFLGEYDPFNSSNQQPSKDVDLPPMENVLRSDMAQGINIDAGFKRSKNKAVMVVRVTNNGQQGISRMDIKFNTNYLGIEPNQTLPLNGTINTGLSQVSELPLDLSAQPQIQNPFNIKVQAAVRVSLSTSKPVYKFEASVPPHIFLETSEVEKNEYLEKWKNIPATDGQSVQLKTLKTADIEGLKLTLSKNNCAFVAPREIPGKGISLYFSSKLRNQLMLIEVAVATSGAGRIQVRSDDKNLSLAAAHAVQTLIG